ncbi:MAG: hypothetical protein SH859_11770 [Hyphomicrobium aestuarii]|nr:hypothetical protein [Hyphomicrobium aestuarii]
MIGDAVLYAANRATGDAVAKVSRSIGWYAAGVLMLIVAAGLVLTAVFWLLQSELGGVAAALVIAGAVGLLGGASLAVPGIIAAREQAEELREAEVSPLADVSEEASHAVDYFGAARVLLTAFVLGMSAGRTVKGR